SFRKPDLPIAHGQSGKPVSCIPSFYYSERFNGKVVQVKSHACTSEGLCLYNCKVILVQA
ncbi:hypothetical protein, partial [Bacteroides heparinolyticus]|uniref:hypothetical protein n=1 Tax=Prevotella heparinolytica TaxID=28113 RepID=UPI0035A10ADC